MVDRRLARLAERLELKPEWQPPPASLRGLDLTDTDLARMRAGTWTPPPPPLEAAAAQAVAAQLAPLRYALEQARGQLQQLADSPPKIADLPEALQTVAQATIAIADALPIDAPNPVEEPT